MSLQRALARRPRRRRVSAPQLVVAAARLAREAEVDDARPAVLAEQHVVGLEVAVHEPGRVRGGQPAPGRDEHVEHLAPRPRLVGEPALERSARDELHREEHLVVEHADVVDGDDVGVREPRHRLRLAQQARAAPCPSRPVPGLEQLERDLAIELGIVRAVDDAHRAGADAFDDDVTADSSAGLEIAGCHARWSCAGPTVLQMSPCSEARAKGALPRRPNGIRIRYSVSTPTWRLIFPKAAMADGRISGTIQQQH